MSSIESRIKTLRSKLVLMKPPPSPPALIIEVIGEINKNAPSGTTVDGETSSFYMLPLGFRGTPPPGLPSLEEWQRANPKSKEKANGK